MRLFITLALAACSVAAFAQDPADIFHKTIDLDAVDQVSLDVYPNDRFEVKTWPGDDILIETSVKITGGKPFMLKFFKENDRYALGETVSGTSMKLMSTDKVRKQVTTADGGSIFENVSIVLYMPDNFSDSGNNTYSRKSK